ncbi:DUF6126 family protein [Streptomyces sp. NPDC007088]|uniref:DUF6126 family protein n=1 Tax=Streptomyces sp. NPDC007088 TaxID=3364773 RepID=UPI00369A6196
MSRPAPESVPETTTPAAPTPESGPAPEAQAAPAGEEDTPRGVRRFVEDKIPRGLAIRLFVYIVAGHGLAAFLFLLFELGAKNQ